MIAEKGKRAAYTLEYKLKLLISLGWNALHLRTLLGCRCCTSDLNPPINKISFNTFQITSWTEAKHKFLWDQVV